MALLPSFSRVDVLNRRIRTMYHQHLIDRIYPPVAIYSGSSQQYVCLDAGGYIVLDQKPRRKSIRNVDGILTLPIDWRHYSRIVDTECFLIKLESEGYLRTIYRSVEQPFRYGNRMIIPDLFAVVSKHYGHAIFFEIDMGTEDIGRIRRKIGQYNQYYESNAWEGEDWTKAFKDAPFPKIMFLTTDNVKRIREIERVVSDYEVAIDVHSYSSIQEAIKAEVEPTYPP